MPAEPDSAEKAVAATTDSYGGPVSDEELAEVYLPAGQDEVEEADTGTGGSDHPGDTSEKSGPPTGTEPPD